MDATAMAKIDANAALMQAYLTFNQAMAHIYYDLSEAGLKEPEITEFLKERKKVCESLVKSVL